MRLATYNVDNLFERPIAMPAPGRPANNQILESYARISDLIARKSYAGIEDKIVQELKTLGLGGSDEGTYATLRQNRGHLIKRDKGTPVVVAAGRASWMGWVELNTGMLADEAIKNSAHVIADKGADVQAIVEVEDRATLRTFAKDLIRLKDGQRYEHAMEFEGNDHRKINVGMLTGHGWEITDMRSHVDDMAGKSKIFSRDCAEYTVTNGSGAELVVLVNHFKSKIGTPSTNDAKRELQAARVAEIYKRLRKEGHDYVAVVGDFNDEPASKPLRPLLSDELKDVSMCASFDDGTLKGADGKGAPLLGTCGKEGKEKFDYILLSPALFERAEGGGIYRKGVWHEPGYDLWQMYPSMRPNGQKPDKGEGSQNAASDHALVYADINI